MRLAAAYARAQVVKERRETREWVDYWLGLAAFCSRARPSEGEKS